MQKNKKKSSVASTKKNAKWRLSFSGVLIGITAIGLSLGLLANYILLNEVSSDLRRAKADYEDLVTSSQTLSYQLEKRVNSGEIEQQAVERLGMQKMEDYQVQHVNLIDEDEIYLAAKESKEDKPGLLDAVGASFNILVEYLR